ncbi:hypothetical protein EHV15_35465 [Paenibacillus oralis]|uniref:Uncharacterized protein n=1 Tax=Paenibacillus oralis TaxID=2490856 RepID=A0A3P3T9Z1_9BACL|nr:hypothetical protein [Paenibacillus oralis]RRJ54875.1 hypothetical protein EHV15_35465 [Paenibacillus oralis]
MQWARYGSEKKNISAMYYREAKHGDVFCRFCNGKMTYVKTGNRSPHFRVSDRKTHTCKYFGNDIEEIVSACSSVVELDRKNNESPIFKLKMKSKGRDQSFAESAVNHSADGLPLRNMCFHQCVKEKELFKFIFDIHNNFLKNEHDHVLQFRFVLEEGGSLAKIKAEDLIPSYKSIIQLDAKGKLSNRKRFIVGSILSAKETVKKNIEVTLRGEKTESGFYINHTVIFMKRALDVMNLHIGDFYKNRPIIVYAKYKMNENKREIISFVSDVDDFDFGKYTSMDGDWLDNSEKREIDDFFYTRNIIHTVPNPTMAKLYFQQENSILVPDWVIFLKEAPVVVDFAERPNDILHGPLELKRDYFVNRKDCYYMNVFKEDLANNYAGLKKKILAIQPNLQLNFYES